MPRRQISNCNPSARRAERHDRAVPTTAPQRPAVDPLIVPRSVAAKMLSVSVGTLCRWERERILSPLKISRAQNGVVFYRVADLQALIGGEHA
jgi:hypothetical protein